MSERENGKSREELRKLAWRMNAPHFRIELEDWLIIIVGLSLWLGTGLAVLLDSINVLVVVVFLFTIYSVTVFCKSKEAKA
jgi:5,10-methylene-tetrahydrofolate dehydrogenase/methenyl tetrahydrofolate cyclohydrolase